MNVGRWTVAITLWMASAASAADLSVTQSGPKGEIASREEANEIRVVFSEPMVVLGRIPDPVTAPFVRIEPALAGTFRWSGTRTLIFTPTKPDELPWATRYAVTVDTGATSVQGNRLAAPHTFSFTTPTLRLLSTSWYRKGGRFDAPVVVGLRFNQPVGATLASSVSLRYEAHDFVAPPAPAARSAEIDPQSLADFEAKVARSRAAAGATGAVAAAPPTSFDKRQFRAGEDLLVLETADVPPSDAWVTVTVAAGARGRQGNVASPKAQAYTIKLEPALFVRGMRCLSSCEPDAWNPVQLSRPVTARAFRARTTVADVTKLPLRDPLPKALAARAEEGEEYDHSDNLTLQDAGYSLKPARTYEIVVDRALTAVDGQMLGYTWAGTMANWHQRAFTSFGSGHGVWEATGGSKLPFSARNLQDVTQWVAPLPVDELMPTLRAAQDKNFDLVPPGAGTSRTLAPVPDRIQSYGIELAGALGPKGTGLVWAGVKDGKPIARAHHDTPQPKSTVVQVTNLGLSVKDSPAGTLVFVTGLADALPVPGATVSIRNLANTVLWTGTTGADGVAVAPALPLRPHDNSWQFSFVVTAEKDGDVAFVGSDWNDGVEAWWFDDLSFDLSEAGSLLRGVVFADRGVYRLGEEARLKAILRADTSVGMALLPAGTTVKIKVTDSQGNDVDTRTVTLNEWSAADWAYTVPKEAPLGGWSISASVEDQSREVVGSFLVAAYRRPDFRVEADLQGESRVAGVGLTGVVAGRYLFGGSMAGRDVRWTFSRSTLGTAPQAVLDRFPTDRWVMADEVLAEHVQNEPLRSDQAKLDGAGSLELKLETDKDAGRPVEYRIEGEVTDVSRQTIAGRARLRIEAADHVVGFKRPSYFETAERGLDTEVVATTLEGKPLAGVAVKLTLTQVQWHSVRQAIGNGFYEWQTERREVPGGEWEVTSTDQPVPLHIDLPSGGYFVLAATATDAEGRTTRSAISFYALGRGYTAWERFDHNRIDLVPEKKTWKPGDTARVLVKSPWETATALLTTEREGVRSHRVFTLDSTQQTVSVPITEADIPNVYVSVLLLKGRTGQFTPEDASDPGKPSFRIGYVKLKVEDASKRLRVAVTTDREEYRPAATARVDVAVTDPKGQPAAAEVTLWAVDYGVLSLTAYRTPDPLSSVWVEKALQVMNENSRQNIISRRVLVSKGGDEGGGGGGDDGSGRDVRRDFRVLAFWLGSLTTDGKGRATTQVKLPESLTTYRVMAVVQDKSSRFGAGEREIRTSKPVLLKQAFPRFLSTGDETLFGSVVHNQLKDEGKAIVTMRSLDPGVLEVVGEARQTVRVAGRSAQEVRFRVRAKSAGSGRLQMSVKLKGEEDAFEDVIPVRVPNSPETVAAYGQVATSGQESIEVPAGVAPGYGGLHVETASTALVGLGEGARYLVEYPYGCAEQRTSATLALMLGADLGDAFRLPGVDPAKMREATATSLDELAGFQCPGGGFAFWKGQCATVSPYVTSWVVHVLQRGKALNYAVKDRVLADAYGYLERELAAPKPTNEGWWPAYTAWQAFVVKVLAQGGRPVDSHLTRLSGYADRMPIFALDFLLDAMTAKGETGERPLELERRIRNAVLPEGGTAHVEELADPYLLWFWNSNVRTTAITLSALSRREGGRELAGPMARWLLQARRNGRWGNTQENAWALLALVDYYRAFESEVPDFGARVTLDGDVVHAPQFRGRTTAAQVKDVPMAELARRAQDDGKLELGFAKEGAGTLFYTARLHYATADLPAEARDLGFRVERRYERAPAPGTTLPADAAAQPLTSFKAGELVRVTLTVRVPKERRYVAVTDPLPAGFEPVESWFATTASDIARDQRGDEEGGSWFDWFERGGFDRVERHDDRVLLFATRLGEGQHVFSYVVRATSSGTFRAGATHAEEMYSPEVFGRTPGAAVTVLP